VTGAWPRVMPLGDRGLVVEFPPEVSAASAARVLGADAVLAALPGVAETVPTLRSVLLVYDPAVIPFADLAERAQRAAREAPAAPLDAGPLVEMPVVYGGAHGPDLEAVARSCSLDPDEVVRLHAQAVYVVFMLGFAPGYAYLGELPAVLRVPRRASPRMRLPAGSVAIADRFTGIYPQETAGGWHVIGRTPVAVFDLDRDPPFLLRPGMRVRFVPAVADTGAAPHRGPRALPPPARPALEIVRPGLMTTVQDLGRIGWRRFGVPPSGALDPLALETANLAVGNTAGAAGLELTFPGPVVRVLDDIEIAVAGADLSPCCNRRPLPAGRAVAVRSGDEITFAAPTRGQWAYLTLSGGVDVPEVFGSRATYARGGLGGVAGRPLRGGDVLGRTEAAPGPRTPRPAGDALPEAEAVVRVVMGPQVDAFGAEARAVLLGQPFEVTVQRDRSGVRLRGPGLRHLTGADILSDGLLPGAIQVPADGQPIVILADGPTTGGYAKIAAVVDADLARVAQARPGTRLRFEAVDMDRARAIRRSVSCSSDACPA
jgi:KipI family sensor histidine kinase inhibitor